MSSYTIAQIETLTGIKSHTLRKWETRYDFLQPNRSETNIRFYTDTQLKKLLNISLLTKNGYRISTIDKMSDTEICNAITENAVNFSAADEINAMVVSMLDMDEEAFDNIIKAQILKRGLFVTTLEIIYPFLNLVGVLWGVNKVIPAQEHFVSHLIKKRFMVAIDHMPYPKVNAPSVVMFLPEHEHHEIGLLLAYYIARQIGWKVYYLGQNVPTSNVLQVMEDTKPNALLCMNINPSMIPLEDRLTAVLTNLSIPFYLFGNPVSMGNILSHKSITYIPHPEDLVKKLQTSF